SYVQPAQAQGNGCGPSSAGAQPRPPSVRAGTRGTGGRAEPAARGGRWGAGGALARGNGGKAGPGPAGQPVAARAQEPAAGLELGHSWRQQQRAWLGAGHGRARVVLGGVDQVGAGLLVALERLVEQGDAAQPLDRGHAV